MLTEVHPRIDKASTAECHLRWQVFADAAKFHELEERWGALAESHASPVEQFAWSAACVDTLEGGRRPAIIAAHRNGEYVALGSFIFKRVRGVGRLTMMGADQLFEPMDLVARERESLDLLAAKLVRAGQPLVLERVPANSPTIAALTRACRGRAAIVCRPGANCPYIALGSNWLEPEQNLNPGRRSDLRRARRKAEQIGAVTTEILVPTPANVDQLFDQVVAIEAKSWKGEAKTALAHDHRRADFFRQYVRRASRDGSLRICLMRIGSEAAAMQIAVVHRGGFWLLKVGYDARFAACSPGLLLMSDTIRHAAESGMVSYEFLGRAENWTAVWTKQERTTVALRVYPYTLRGLAALVLDSADAVVRRWRKS